jgi:hypothetical protein
MGIQAFIKPEALRAAGCVVSFIEERETFYGDGYSPEEVVSHYARVLLPDEQELFFHVTPSGVIWIDANHWGDNRRTHLEPLAALGVTWEEC